ncbi:hypothetical protein NST17_10760 [Caldifermentibacillus hisashii]|jgi:hypothetical protein|nr:MULTISPECIES: hypothetical protein [Bacillaceae]AWI12664.1 hypothetical protein CQJ30_11180 [Caldibacillus thermoamylovorans]MCM3053244.1 hypothetical protein [Caldibacillus thermoamylovorans]
MKAGRNYIITKDGGIEMASNKTVKTSEILELIKCLEMEIALVEQKMHLVVTEEIIEQTSNLSRNISAIEKEIMKVTKENQTKQQVRNTEPIMKQAASM